MLCRERCSVMSADTGGRSDRVSRRRMVQYVAGGSLCGLAGCSELVSTPTATPTATPTGTVQGPEETETPETTDEIDEPLASNIDRLKQLDQEIHQLATSDRFSQQAAGAGVVPELVAKLDELRAVLQEIETNGHEIVPTFEDDRLKLVINSPTGSLLFGASLTTVTAALAGYLVIIGALSSTLSSQFIIAFVTSLGLPQLLAQTTDAVLRYAWLNYFGLNSGLQSDLQEEVTQDLVQQALDAVEDDLRRAVMLSPEQDDMATLLILEIIHVIYTQNLTDELQDVTLSLLEYLERTAVWPQFHFDATNTGSNPDGASLETVTLEWQSELDVGTSFAVGMTGTGAVGRNLLYVGGSNPDGTQLTALDPQTGDEVWTQPYDTHNWITTPAIDASSIYFGTYEGTVYAINRYTQAEQWSVETGDIIWASPTIKDGTVYIGGKDHRLHAIDGDTGSEQWAFETEWEINATVAVANDSVYIADGDGHIYAVDAATGDEIWQFEGENYIEAAPTVVDGTVYTGKDAVYALDADDGDKQWAFTSPNLFSTSPSVGDGTVYVATTLWPEDIKQTGVSPALYAIDTQTGTQKWEFTVDDEIFSAPIVADGSVYFGCNDANLYALDGETGAKQWSFEADHAIGSSPLIIDDTIYFASQYGTLYSLTES